MGKKLFLVLIMSYVPQSVMASAKSKFLDAVVSQCGKSQDEAKKLATPGRTGTVVQFKLCASPTVDLGGGCKVSCTKGGASIGK